RAAGRQAGGDPRRRARRDPARPMGRQLRDAARRDGRGSRKGRASAPRGREDAMTKSAPQPRPGILDIAAYVGGESKIEGVSKVIKLASNESALGPSPKAMAAYSALAG